MKRVLSNLSKKLNNALDQYKKISPNKNISNSYTDIEKELNFEENTSVIPTKL